MTIPENFKDIQDIKAAIERAAPVPLGVNKINELTRLVYEVSRRDRSSPEIVLEKAGAVALAGEGKSHFFRKLKDSLLAVRYPSIKKADDPALLPLSISEDSRECAPWEGELKPRRIYAENSVSGEEWTKKIIGMFPGAEVVPMGTLKEFLSGAEAKRGELSFSRRRENIFLVRAKDSFIKKCPCTKSYRRCGYWILNMGFGCPVDCSYCFLQSYSNAPGIVLPANIGDYLSALSLFDKSAAPRSRVGTGEFADSLALDRYTGYSAHLIPFFGRLKNLVLELKTKTSDIGGVLGQKANDNVVISWSVNAFDMAQRYEKGAPGAEERIDAASRAAKAGYRVGFHFDPIIYHDGWEKGYKAAVDAIFARRELVENTVWISLGTLRYMPPLKQAAEERFSDNRLYYGGEFFKDTDGKMRYPRELRSLMYSKMAGWIKGYKPPLCRTYLCMEPREIWESAGLEN
jgi:spore photoproduct lyase